MIDFSKSGLIKLEPVPFGQLMDNNKVFLDCELELYVSSIGKIHFEIRGAFDTVGLNKAISMYVLA